MSTKQSENERALVLNEIVLCKKNFVDHGCVKVPLSFCYKWEMLIIIVI